MSYWNALGLNGSPLTYEVEQGAKFVQWAQYGQGDESKIDAVKYNLQQFWALKNRVYYSDSNAIPQWDKLDSIANGILYNINVKKSIQGDESAQNMAEKARIAAAAAASRAGGAWAANVGSLYASRIPTGYDMAKIAEDYQGMPSPGGIPWSTIGIAAGILILAFLVRD